MTPVKAFVKVPAMTNTSDANNEIIQQVIEEVRDVVYYNLSLALVHVEADVISAIEVEGLSQEEIDEAIEDGAQAGIDMLNEAFKEGRAVGWELPS